MAVKKDICILEPYYGGSHRAVIDLLIERCGWQVRLFTLPARSWKWRMRFAAPWLAEQLRDLDTCATFFCSTFVDVATLRGLLPPHLAAANYITYFHENQFTYPVQVAEPRDLHFAITNLTSALASHRVVFNSRYNRDGFLNAAHGILRKCPDMTFPSTIDRLAAKCEIIPPAMKFEDIDAARPLGIADGRGPIILWNHRWEHDKNPALFMTALKELAARKIPFRVVVLGQDFAPQAELFEGAKLFLGDRLLHLGKVDRPAYCRWLVSADVVVSCAVHEFFGISIMEAVRAGCRPVLPRRLAYPELFPAEFLYADDTALPMALEQALHKGRLDWATAAELTAPFTWERLGPRYQELLAGK